MSQGYFLKKYWLIFIVIINIWTGENFGNDNNIIQYGSTSEGNSNDVKDIISDDANNVTAKDSENSQNVDDVVSDEKGMRLTLWINY